MQKNNLSESIAFVTEENSMSKPNTGFESMNTIAFEAETTGVLMQLDGLNEKNLITDGDKQLVKSIVKNHEHQKAYISEENKDEVTYEAIMGEINDIIPNWFLRLGDQRSRAICLISTSGIDYKGRKSSWRGTGFLISDNILLTNYHVLNSKDVCGNAICAFNYEIDDKGKIQSTRNYQLNPGRLFITSPHTELDFCFIWVDGNPGSEFGHIPLLRHAFVVKDNDFANIIQHPEGKVKSIALQNNQVMAQKETVVHYTTDTLSGSSGAVVCNNEWKAFALHHASRELKPADVATHTPAVYINEGIKLSAIATYLESIGGAQGERMVSEVLQCFQDTDAMLGFFGGLGRDKHLDAVEDGLERVVEVYKGEAKDLDIAFWNIEWFNKHYRQKIEEVAKAIVRMNMDVWVLEESSPRATKMLVEFLKNRYNLDYDYSASEPDASDGKQTTTILWNVKTVAIERREWSDKVKAWLELESTTIDNPEDLVLESELLFEKVDGKIFDRYPGLFYMTSQQRATEDKFGAFIVPLHLKAMAEGSKRRILASKILVASIQSMIEDGADEDWILGGDFNATLASEDFNFLLKDFVALSADDEHNGEMTYIKGKFKSLIDHIFVSTNMQNTQASEFIIVAQDKVLPDYLSISDHRPVLIRLSLNDKVSGHKPGDRKEDKQTELVKTLQALGSRKQQDRYKLKSRPSHNEAELNQQLEEARSIRNREYYDEVKDKSNIQQYYGQIPSRLTGAKMFSFLHDLVTTTHTKVLGYKPSTYLYPWVDLQPDGETILNIYSGDTTTPEALIVSDFESAQQVAEAFNTRFPKDGLEADLTHFEAEYLEALENSQGFNCEHVVPQSWFNKVNPMKGDLHHLYSCTPNCNSFRSNIPYFEHPEWEEKSMDNCGLREPEGFEPKEGKGKVARATLYFLVRYPKVISQYSPQVLQDLIAWHINEPPTLYEKHRNASIQELQGNRNPFIDFPRLSSKVDFTKGLK